MMSLLNKVGMGLINVAFANKILLKISIALVSILGSLILVFFIIYLLPGDPVLSMLDPATATPEMVENLRKELGLNQPFYVQFTEYFTNVLHGDFGQSLVNSEPVLQRLL
jgi:peptide/nickel transport system permease protein